jgi:predicted dehydrogenase
MKPLGILIIGTGKVSLANHVPGIAMTGRAKVVALCDANETALAAASRQTGISKTFTDFNQAIADDAVDAVVIATPNITHPPMVLAAAAAKKHVLCEKPLALDVATTAQMHDAAEKAGIRHMTAFTYRFVPAMRYMSHLVQSGAIGTPWHFRAQRFQDWEDRDLGWRQEKKLAGTGELGDMLSHRIDYGHLLLGPMRRLVANMKVLSHNRQGHVNDTDDWVAILADYQKNDVTGVLESTKLATGRGEGYGGRDDVELNGSEGSIVYSTQNPHELRIGKKGETEARVVPLPKEFLVWPGSPRDPSVGDPRVTFRYDQSFEFVDAILSQRPCRPTLRAGLEAQAVMDAAVKSYEQQKWLDVKYPL